MIDLYITLPNHFPNMNSIELIPGYINHIKLEMLRIKRIKHHYYHHHHHHHHHHHRHHHEHQHQSLCNENKFSTIIYDGDLMNKRLIYGSNELCHRILSQYLYLNECHCYSPFLPYGYYAKQCDLLHHLPYCDHVYYQNFGIHRIIMNELWSNTYNDARATFLIRTFRDVFTNNTTTTYNNTTYNTTYNNEKLTTQQILLEMRNNFGLLIIERNRPQGKLVREEQEYSLAQLLSDIGGNMGLWIGISARHYQQQPTVGENKADPSGGINQEEALEVDRTHIEESTELRHKASPHMESSRPKDKRKTKERITSRNGDRHEKNEQELDGTRKEGQEQSGLENAGRQPMLYWEKRAYVKIEWRIPNSEKSFNHFLTMISIR
ncbi:unnamed protein product [Schistosoma mattheei]|uniref:Uncharacterized protein n=1 Tax=Schistosoma mattheei TaxID=31246 RepID=A0A183PCQ2_9TREM|nr:unnamed protein product [Schistosoma mattheei]